MVGVKTMERRSLAKGLKVWIDILFYLSLVAGGLLALIWPIAALTGSGDIDLSIPVSIGESSLFPVHPLEMDAGGIESTQAELARQAEGARQSKPDSGTGPFSLVDARGELRYSEPALTPVLVYWSHHVVLFGALIYGLLLLRRILATVAEGRPFHPTNPTRLNRLGWIIVVTGVLAPISQFFFGVWFLARYPVTGIPLSPSVEVFEEWVFAGLLVLVLAAIWKEAVGMAEEQSLTV